MTREQIIISLTEAHQAAWGRRPQIAGPWTSDPTHPRFRFHIWRTEWWNELAKAFPDKIQPVVVRRDA